MRTACGIELPPPRPDLGPAFERPRGGRIVVRRSGGGALLCRLLRADGSRFAEAFRDGRGRILSLIFFRRNGEPLTSVEAAYPAVASDFGTHVRCASGTYASLSREYWRTKLEWSMGPISRRLSVGAAVNAVRAAFGEWINNRNYCRLPDSSAFYSQYLGRTTRRYAGDDHNTVDWGSMARIPGCRGALACTQTWYVMGGGATESDIRFSTSYPWITGSSRRGYDIQMTAAHEIGHALQFDHVGSVARRDWTNVMWPFEEKGEKSGRRLGRGDALADNAHY